MGEPRFYLVYRTLRNLSAVLCSNVPGPADAKSIATTVQHVVEEAAPGVLHAHERAATVCICAHNEAEVLADAVASVMAQQLSADRYEVLVVDSASDDRTPGVLTALQAKWGSRLRWVREDEPGLSRARNRGLAEANGAIVAYIDADAIAQPNWLGGILSAFESDEQAGAVGGPIAVRWDQARPTWWRSELDEVFNFYAPSATLTTLTYPKYPYGTNLAVRTNAAAALGGFSNALGRQRRMLYGGEDGEMCLRLERAGWNIVFTPEAPILHRTKNERLSRGFVLRRALKHGRSQRRIERMHGFDSGLYPSLGTLFAMCLGRVLTLRCNLLFLKFAAFRLGYRLEGMRRGIGSEEPSPRPSPMGRGGKSMAHSNVGALH